MAIDFSHPGQGHDEDVLDLDLVTWDATDDGWVTVAAAARAAGVGTGAVRHWYRTGRLPTHRSSGDHGAFLVRLDAVVALAHEVEVEATTGSPGRDLDDLGADPSWLDLPLAEAAATPAPSTWAALVDGPGFVLGHQPDDVLPQRRHLRR